MAIWPRLLVCRLARKTLIYGTKKKHSHSEPENENEIKNRGLTKNISLHILNKSFIERLIKGYD